MASSYRHGVVSPPRFRLSTQDIYHSLETGQMAPSYRHNGVVSPPRFRQSTQDIYHSLETGQHTAMTSALDRKWVHRSLGDLSSESDFQRNHPRLASTFYQDLYRKYPRAFQRKQEAREAGRKLFNPRPHVRFEDDYDDMSLKSARSERPTTNWDREVGHYKNVRSRQCFTSAEPSETGSVLSVKERLHLNSQTLQRLLNEKSPLRKRFTKDSNGHLQYDSGTENESTGRDTSLSNRTRLRFRHRKVLQRKVDNNQNGAIEGRLSELRKPKSYSREYTRRARTVSPTNSKHRHVDVESLMANADLEINTLLEKFTMKMGSPDSPPDSAIDVDTPSVRSLATVDRGSNLDLRYSNPKESSTLQNYNKDGVESNSPKVTDIMSHGNIEAEVDISDPLKDPDNILLLKEYGIVFSDMQLEKDVQKDESRSDQVLAKETRSESDIQAFDIDKMTNQDLLRPFTQSDILAGNGQIIDIEKVTNQDLADPFTQSDMLAGNSQTFDNDKLTNQDLVNPATQSELSAGRHQTFDIDKQTNQDLVGPATQSQLTGKGQGLLQCFKMDSTAGNEGMLLHATELTNALTTGEYSHNDLVPCNMTQTSKTNGNLNSNIKSNENSNSNIGCDLKEESERVENDQQVTVLSDVSQERVDNDQQVTVLSDVSQDKNYQADDEAEVIDDVVIPIHSSETRNIQKIPLHRDSDVDSGIGQSGTETRSPAPVAPPRGRSRQRGSASKSQPVKADHSILPLRSEVDSCILDELNLNLMSFDPSHIHQRRERNLIEEIDDTDPQRESVTVTADEQKVSEKYRRKRSPSPYVLKVSRQPSPRCRAQSAPLFYSKELDLRIVDISLSNESLSDLSSNVSSANNNLASSGIDSYNSSQLHPDESVQTIISCQRNRQSSPPKQLSTVSNDPQILTSNLTNGQSNIDRKLLSSSPVEQRKSSSSTYSITSVSSVGSEQTLHGGHVTTSMDSVLKQEDMYDAKKLLNGAVQTDNSLNSISKINDDSRNSYSNAEETNTKHHSNDELVQNTATDEINTNCNDKKGHTSSDTQYLKQYESSEQMFINENERDTKEYKIKTEQNSHDTIVQNNSLNIKHAPFSSKQVEVIEGSSGSNSFDEDMLLHSAKELQIVNHKLGTQVSVESAESFESVDLSETEVPKQKIQPKEVRRIYKPSVTSPRVSENKANTRNIIRHKKGRFSPSNQNISESPVNGINGVEAVGKTASRPLTPHHTTVEEETEIADNVDELMNSANNPVYFAKPVMLNSPVSHNPPNVKPPRHKKKLLEELNLSQYKIKTDKRMDSDSLADQNMDTLSQSHGDNKSRDSQQSQGSSVSYQSARSQASTKSQESPRSQNSTKAIDSARSRMDGTRVSDKEQVKDMKKKSSTEEGEIEVIQSNLVKTKGLSASKGSLLDKMGGIKTATKGKFKAMRKAMSLERGIDQVGNDPDGGSGREPASGAKGGHSIFHKMKKAPSLKSISAFFGRKKKKGKFTAEDIEASTSATAGSASIESSSSLSSEKRRQWASCHTLSSKEGLEDSRPVGKLQRMNPDGTQVVELTRPPNGPLGFFIAQGSSKYKQGIFISRFSQDGPERLSGLLGVGDEILEVNRHLVYDLSLDAVYKLMGSSQIIVLKIFPLLARKDF